MKVNLHLGDYCSYERNGYVNLDGSKRFIHDLSDMVDANEASEILALDVINHFPFDEIEGVMNHWVSRLSHGGKITISSLDVNDFACSIISGGWNLTQINELLYGKKDELANILTMDTLSGLLIKNGLKITMKKFVDGKAVVEAVRP